MNEKICYVGYGKYEAVGSLTVGAILVGCGLSIGLDGLHSLQAVLAGASGEAFPSFTVPFMPGKRL
jgi:divalent metal cation (Fe/Co/Zn/Cd) transporter